MFIARNRVKNAKTGNPRICNILPSQHNSELIMRFFPDSVIFDVTMLFLFSVYCCVLIIDLISVFHATDGFLIFRDYIGFLIPYLSLPALPT